MTSRPAAGTHGLLLHASPLRTVEGLWRRILSRSWLREVSIIALLYVAYEVSRGLSDASVLIANKHAASILRWERVLHLDPEHGLNNGLARVPALGVVSSYYYTTLHYIVTPAVLVWMYCRHSEHYRGARRTLAVASACGLLIFCLFPATPPRLLPGAGFHDTMADSQAWGWWSGAASAPRGLGGLTDQLAAMPSLHVAWALWSGILIARWARRRWVRLIGVVYPLATTLVVTATANHYLFDALAGAAVLAISAGFVVGVSALLKSSRS